MNDSRYFSMFAGGCVLHAEVSLGCIRRRSAAVDRDGAESGHLPQGRERSKKDPHPQLPH